MATGCVPDIEKSPREWVCSKQCKPLNDSEVVSIVIIRAASKLFVEEVLQALANCDLGCPNGHYTKALWTSGNEPTGAVGNVKKV